MNELQAAIGLLNLELYKKEQEKREVLREFYNSHLEQIKGIKIPKMPKNVTDSYQYYPIVIEDDYPLNRDELYDKLKLHNIYTRKYFYPICSDYECYKDLPSSSIENLPVANDYKNRVLCLPFYSDLEEEFREKICRLIKDYSKISL